MNIPRQLSGVHYGPAPRGFGASLGVPPRWIVIHDTGNTASASDEAHFAASRNDPEDEWTSAHFYVDSTGIIGSVPLDEQAWAAFHNANEHSWHIERCGMDAGQPGAVPFATDQLTAQLVARLIQQAGGAIPVAHVGPDGIKNGVAGIAGHLDFTEAEHRIGGHTDPGYAFDWHTFITMVTAALGDLPMPAPDPSWTETLMNNLPTLRRGSAGSAVRRLQALIIAAGGSVGPAGIDGVFGGGTEAGLAHLQAAHHIPNSVRTDGTGDGIAGRGTWTWLLTWS